MISELKLSDQLVDKYGSKYWAIERRLSGDEWCAIEGTDGQTPMQAWERCARILMVTLCRVQEATSKVVW